MKDPSIRQNLLGTPALAEDQGGPVGVSLPLNFCVANFNKLSGVAQTLIDKGKLSEYTPFRTFRWMFSVDAVFMIG